MEFNISWHPKIPDQNLICILLVPRESFVAGPRSYEFANDNTFRAEEVTHFSSVGRTLNYWQRGWNYLVSPWNFSFLKILPYKKISSWPCRSKCVIMAWSWCDHGVFTPTNCMISFSNTVICFKNTQAFLISYVLLVACPHGKVVGRGWFRKALLHGTLTEWSWASCRFTWHKNCRTHSNYVVSEKKYLHYARFTRSKLEWQDLGGWKDVTLRPLTVRFACVIVKREHHKTVCFFAHILIQ